MIRIIVEVEGGCITGVYTNAQPELDIEAEVLDRDFFDEEAEDEAEALDTMLRGSGWRGIY